MLFISSANHRVFLCLLTLLSCFLAHSMALKEREFLCAQAIKNGYITRDASGFHVIKKNKQYDVQPCFVDKKLKKYSPEQLKAFLQCGYMKCNRMSDGKYTIERHVRGLGGGPVLGGIFYGITKGACYAGLVGAGTAAVCATGGIGAGAIVGGVGAVGAMGAGAAAGTALATGIGGAVGVAATTTTGIATTAVIAGSAVAAYGSVVAGIEALSWAAFALGTAIPFL